jgi:hypothetical protein
MKPGETVRVRLDAATLARVDALASALSLVGGKQKRPLALQVAILMGIERFEAERAAQEPQRKGGRG